jgi:hypothetical protein
VLANRSLENPGNIPLELIEVQTGSSLGEDDIIGVEDEEAYRCALRKRTPGPPPFSAMNSTPPFSSALRTSSSVRGYGTRAPRSKSATVFVAVLLASERSD